MSAQTEVSDAYGMPLEQNKKVQELTNNRLAGIDTFRSADKPASPAPAAAPESSLAAKTAGVEGQVQARNGALDYSARANSGIVTVRAQPLPRGRRRHNPPSARRRTSPARTSRKKKSRQSVAQQERRLRIGRQIRSRAQPQPALRLNTLGVSVRTTICPGGRSPPTALSSAPSTPERPGRQFQWRVALSSARWRQMIPTSGWAAPPVLLPFIRCRPTLDPDYAGCGRQIAERRYRRPRIQRRPTRQADHCKP